MKPTTLAKKFNLFLIKRNGFLICKERLFVPLNLKVNFLQCSFFRSISKNSYSRFKLISSFSSRFFSSSLQDLSSNTDSFVSSEKKINSSKVKEEKLTARKDNEQNAFCDMKEIANMSSRDIRILAENLCATKNDNLITWSLLTAECIKKSNTFKYFDLIITLKCFHDTNIYDKTLFFKFSEALINQMSLLQTRHILDVIEIYEKNHFRPRLLYVEMFHALIKLSNNMYGSEYADVLCALARHKIANGQLIKHFCVSVIKNINLFDYTDICCITGATRSLAVSHDFFFECLDKKQNLELKSMTIQEVYDTLKKVRFLEFGWAPFEKNIKNEFIERLAKMDGEHSIDELADPFECLQFLKLNGFIQKEFLRALCRWCAAAVYRPPTRSYKRPLSHQLVELYDLLSEYDMQDDKYLKKAILRFVSSKGGTDRGADRHIKPIAYQKGRRYFLLEDPLEDKIKEYKNESNEWKINTEEEEQDDKREADVTSNGPNQNKLLWFNYAKSIKKSSTIGKNRATFKLRIRTKRIKNCPVEGYVKPT